MLIESNKREVFYDRTNKFIQDESANFNNINVCSNSRQKYQTKSLSISKDVGAKNSEIDSRLDEIIESSKIKIGNSVSIYINNNLSSSLTKEPDSIDKIKRLHELKEEGIVTVDEFESKKKELMEKI